MSLSNSLWVCQLKWEVCGCGPSVLTIACALCETAYGESVLDPIGSISNFQTHAILYSYRTICKINEEQLYNHVLIKSATIITQCLKNDMTQLAVAIGVWV